MKLTTDSQGRFKGVIPFMHYADNAEMLISAAGYQTDRLDGLVDIDLRIFLYRQRTPTPGM
jgi:hypothetical protein